MLSLATAAFYTLVTALTALAWLRKGDACVATLILALICSVIVAQVPMASPIPALAVIDSLTCLMMAWLRLRHRSMRAWSIGFIGLGKGMVSVSAMWSGHGEWFLAYALVIDGAFLAQLLIAGGWADAVGIRADHLCARFAPVRHRLLHHGLR